jgi:hypothetical protein
MTVRNAQGLSNTHSVFLQIASVTPSFVRIHVERRLILAQLLFFHFKHARCSPYGNFPRITKFDRSGTDILQPPSPFNGLSLLPATNQLTLGYRSRSRMQTLERNLYIYKEISQGTAKKSEIPTPNLQIGQLHAPSNQLGEEPWRPATQVL